MASEDSEQVGPGLLAIHRLRDLHDVGQSLSGEMVASIDELDTLRKLLEVAMLRRMQPMRPEERNDRRDQIRTPAHNVAIQVLAVVVVPLISDYLSHPEKALEFVQARHALRALRDCKLVSHLIAGSVAGSAPSATLAYEAD